ncbi:MAG: helix-turn-helix domain-containing protein [Acidobacteriia bacterium]|nr:helix-turn-helix domain-containing protein [Terriglobia bacterium]
MIDTRARRERQGRPAQPVPRPLEELLTAGEVGDLLKMSARFVHDHRKEMGGVRVGGRLRFRRVGVEKYLHRIE